MDKLAFANNLFVERSKDGFLFLKTMRKRHQQIKIMQVQDQLRDVNQISFLRLRILKNKSWKLILKIHQFQILYMILVTNSKLIYLPQHHWMKQEELHSKPKQLHLMIY